MVEGTVVKILFLNPPFGYQRPEGLDAPMGIMYLAAVLKQAGHRCFLVDHVWEKEGDWRRWDLALAEKPDLVLINTQIRFRAETDEAVRRLRLISATIPVIAFGPQASTEAPGLLLATGFDACVIGEPEEVILQVLKDEFNEKSFSTPRPGLATKKNIQPGPAPRVKVESLPFPDWDFVNYGRYIKTTHNAVYMASRGLNYEDKFNQPPLIYAASPTLRLPVERVIAELTELRRHFPGQYMLLFHDEVFTEDRAWVIELCARLRKAKFSPPYWCFTRPDLVDLDLCRIMRQSGFVGVSLGMESGSDRILKMLGKNMTVQQIEKGFRAAQKAGFLTTGSVMIGTAGGAADESDETDSEIAATKAMVRRLQPDVLTITLTTPLPGTPLYGRLKNKILAKSDQEFNIYYTWPGKYPLKLQNLSADDLAKYVAEIRRVWKKGLWKTFLRMSKLAVLNSAFRCTLFDQVMKVISRKVWPGREI